MRTPSLVALAVLTFSQSAAAEQFVLVDADYTHTKESHAYAKPLTGIPTNWRTPVNYAEGTAYYHLEVYEKPSTENLNMGVCFVGASYCCFGYERFTKPGTYDWSFAIPSMWQYDAVDFTKPITEIPFIMRDRNAIKVDPGVEMFYGAPSTALYFPMKTHLKITIVSKGATYMEPVVDAGAPDTSAVDTGIAVDTGDVIDTGTTAVEDTMAPAADATPSAAESGAAPEAEAFEGSACATGRSSKGSSGSLFLLLAGLAAWRRSAQARGSRSRGSLGNSRVE